MAKKKANKATPTRKAKVAKKKTVAKPRCGLCGATKNLTKTECCDQWICDDEDNYVMFSYARKSCSRNHRRYTLCGAHFTEGHPGDWKECKKCRKGVETEMYVYYGTNEYNFDVLENPPEYEPTRCAKCGNVIVMAGARRHGTARRSTGCAKCGNVIVMAEGGYSYGRGGYNCGNCVAAEHPDLFKHLS